MTFVPSPPPEAPATTAKVVMMPSSPPYTMDLIQSPVLLWLSGAFSSPSCADLDAATSPPLYASFAAPRSRVTPTPPPDWGVTLSIGKVGGARNLRWMRGVRTCVHISVKTHMVHPRIQTILGFHQSQRLQGAIKSFHVRWYGYKG